MTQCFRPLAPSDEELLRYALDGEALSIAAKEHLEECALCQQRLASYTATNSFILSRLYRAQCPDATTLSHYCAGMLPPNEEARVTGHLEFCPLCANEVAETRLLLENFEPFPAEPGAPSEVQSTVSYIVASPIPWQPQPLEWNGHVGESQQLWSHQYRAEMLSVSLCLVYDEQGGVSLLGWLASANGAEQPHLFKGTKVELYTVHNTSCFLLHKECHSQADLSDMHDPLLSTYVDDSGRMLFQSVPPGPYLMIIYLPEFEVVIEELRIQPR